MCVVSMIGDHYSKKWSESSYQAIYTNFPEITRVEFEQLKKEVQEMKELLRKAKIYDEENGEPDCEIEDKIAKLREVAKLVGIDLDEVLRTQKEDLA